MAAKPVKKTTVKRKKPNGYQMPGHIPQGEVLKDTGKNEWIIDTSIGVGGFGEIYSAFKSTNLKQNNYVVKIEPSENGPLFCERNVYVRIGKKDDIQEFMNLKKLKSLGMPQYWGFGSHECDGTKYRFLVMERYGRDLWSLFLENGKVFPTATVFKVSAQIIDVLEYIHVKSYVHADIKGANLLLGRSKGLENQVYLVDFGLASRYPTTEFKPDPKKAHNGTIEYTSRDAHLGVTTRRGDIEILGYNMLHWLSSTLPWEKLKDCPSVQTQKNKYMGNAASLFKACFKEKEVPDTLKKYFDCLCKMEPLDEPDYDKLRKILNDGIKKSGRLDNKLDFATPKKLTVSSPRSAKSRKIEMSPTSSAKENSTSSDSKEDTPKSKSTSKTKTKAKTITKTRTPKQEVVVKKSWRDFPTIVNGAMKPPSPEVKKKK